jgi:hypothetical protein
VFVRPTAADGEKLRLAIAAFGFPTLAFTPADVVAGSR